MGAGKDCLVTRYLLVCLIAFIIERQGGGHLAQQHKALKVSVQNYSIPAATDSYHYSAISATRIIQAWCTMRRKRIRRRYTRKDLAMFWLAFLIALSGDIKSNPGPRNLKYPCGTCGKSVTTRQKGVACDTCDGWYHTKCMGIRATIYQSMGNALWHCLKCALPNVSLFFDNHTDLTTPNRFDSLRELSVSLESRLLKQQPVTSCLLYP